jgi:two-component system chemotaxis response regulator CheB
LRILLADGSVIYKKIFAKAMYELGGSAVLDLVSSGEEARAFMRRRNYDIVLIDAEISPPGLHALISECKRVMPHSHALVTARPSPTNSRLCAEALALGASECIIKPIYESYSGNVDLIKGKMLDILKEPFSRSRRPARQDGHWQKAHRKKTLHNPDLILIASSTGGPVALEAIFSRMSADLPAPILLVQHIPHYFTGTLAGHLNQKSALRVKVAENGESISAGTVYMAPGNVHMLLEPGGKILLDGSPPKNGVRPAADTLFESVSESLGKAGILTVILTGMGSDGARGLGALKQKCNCVCFAQNEETCVVYGMPRAAVESGCVDKILALHDIPPEIEKLFDMVV